MGVDNEKGWKEATLRLLKVTIFGDTSQPSIMTAPSPYSCISMFPNSNALLPILNYLLSF